MLTAEEMQALEGLAQQPGWVPTRGNVLMLLADLRAMRAAAAAFEANLSEYCDGPERDALRAALGEAP